MRGSWILAAALAFGTMAFATPAGACAYNPVICMGGGPGCNPSPAERRARQQRWSGEQTRNRAIAARERLRTGQVDFAAELAELLVPNVRPVLIETSDCGPLNEVDFGAGQEDEEAAFRKLVAGTSLARIQSDIFWSRFGRELRDTTFGARCNEEFRGSFAVYLRQSVELEKLRQAWLFLTARQRTDNDYGIVYHRLVRFDDRARTPPVQWYLADEWLAEQVRRYIRRQTAGRSVAAAADAFWAERGADLQDDSLVCPVYTAQWQSARESLVPQMIEYWQSLLRRASTQPRQE